jgi:hypothetical protein
VGLVDLGGAHPVDPALAALYRDLIVAAMESRSGRIRELAHEIGFVTAADAPGQVDGVVRLLELGCEAFGQRGVYDFGASDLPARLRDHALDLAFAKGHRRPPPPRTLFLHRKLAGTFLLCARLRARVPLRDIAEPILAGPLAA